MPVEVAGLCSIWGLGVGLEMGACVFEFSRTGEVKINVAHPLRSRTPAALGNAAESQGEEPGSTGSAFEGHHYCLICPCGL
ncbi:hypothetical protein AAFF_G00359380 [Aldrovandia affinis]|uniref:Uncharacterized protein n=1 Tax=Aldrovandia affinis TaxID=143900 RepID=A0AAD7SI44_9TELE|nr:hypothetical protein AAFF_G00359380 [Aldrovandia affinis]